MTKLGCAIRLGVKKHLGKFTLDCQLEIANGITAIFGPSGSGKTTLLDCIAGFLSPDQGCISKFGRIVFSSERSINVSPNKRGIGYVVQNSALFPHLTVKENINYGFSLTSEQRRKYSLETVMEILDIAYLSERDTRNLSGGERQRVALARSLAAFPDILLLDEPLASLDAPFRGLIIQKLKVIFRELGIPMIYVSHSLSEVIALAHQVVVMSEGSVLGSGNVSILLGDSNVKWVADFSSFENILQGFISPVGIDGQKSIAIGDTKLILPVERLEGEEKEKVSAIVSIRASDIILSKIKPIGLSARNVISARVKEVHNTDSSVLVECDIGEPIYVEITSLSQSELGIYSGTEVFLIIKASSIMVLGN
jgi:molybdate transport system ATP-binding protein